MTNIYMQMEIAIEKLKNEDYLSLSAVCDAAGACGGKSDTGGSGGDSGGNGGSAGGSQGAEGGSKGGSDKAHEDFITYVGDSAEYDMVF